MDVVGPSCVEPAPNSNKILSFSGDPEEEEEGEGGDSNDPAVDLFAEVSKAEEEEGEEEPGEHGADEAEPEDDFNAAWEVLDLARAIYEKQMDGDDEMRLKAADTLVMLGDISLETGAFPLFLQLHTNPPSLPSFTFCRALKLHPREVRSGHLGLYLWARAENGAAAPVVSPPRRGAL
jgi:hypothetical protein